MEEKKQIYVGGQAVIEGVMMRGPACLATAIRRKDGTLEIWKKPFVTITSKVKFFGLPIIRGFVSLIEMLKIGLETLTFSAQRFELDLTEDEKGKPKSAQREKAEEYLTYIVAFGLAFLLFGLLPYKLSDLMKLSKTDFFFNLFAGGIRIVFFVLYIYLISLMKDVKRLFRYHGAEHKNVNAYEHETPLQIPEIQKWTTLHPRCGTSFMFFVLLISILVFSIIDTCVSAFILHKPVPVLLRLGYHILLIPLVSGISYEVLRYSGRNLKHPLVKVMTVPGMALQHITTQPPDDQMVETALVAMKVALDLDISEHKVTWLER
jgi:uncharacterized protein YqhQ